MRSAQSRVRRRQDDRRDGPAAARSRCWRSVRVGDVLPSHAHPARDSTGATPRACSRHAGSPSPRWLGHAHSVTSSDPDVSCSAGIRAAAPGWPPRLLRFPEALLGDYVHFPYPRGCTQTRAGAGCSRLLACLRTGAWRGSVQIPGSSLSFRLPTLFVWLSFGLRGPGTAVSRERLKRGLFSSK